MTTTELTLKEAICAMLDGEEVETRFDGDPWRPCKFDGNAFRWGELGPTVMSEWNHMEFRRKPVEEENPSYKKLREQCSLVAEQITYLSSYTSLEKSLFKAFVEAICIARDTK